MLPNIYNTNYTGYDLKILRILSHSSGGLEHIARSLSTQLIVGIVSSLAKLIGNGLVRIGPAPHRFYTLVPHPSQIEKIILLL